VTPRTFPPAPGWSPDGHRIKAPLEYGRGEAKVWGYGAPRERDGQVITLPARARNTAGYLRLLDAVDAANPDGDLYLIADNLSSHKSPPVGAWVAAHPRVQQVFLPTGAGWLNLQEAWWRLVRKEALAGQTFGDGEEVDRAPTVATQQLNRRAKPWIGGRPPRPKRRKRRWLVYRI
jgi:hypothetical protein